MALRSSLPLAQHRNTEKPEEASSLDTFARLSSEALAMMILATGFLSSPLSDS